MVSCLAPAARAASADSTLLSKTCTHERHAGLFVTYTDARAGRLWLELPPAAGARGECASTRYDPRTPEPRPTRLERLAARHGPSEWGLVPVALVLIGHAPVVLARPAIAPMLGAAVTDVAGNVLYRLALQRTPLSFTATLVSLAPAMTVLLAQVVLKEAATGNS